MKFEEFKNKVHKLGDVWGLPTESTEEDQVRYGKQEFLEYLEEQDDHKAAMELCDIVVFAINAARYKGSIDYKVSVSPKRWGLWNAYGCFVRGNYSLAIDIVCGVIAEHHCADIESLFDKTWEKISKRKGMMIDGKFVKYESMNEEQKAEFNERDKGNTLIRED